MQLHGSNIDQAYQIAGPMAAELWHDVVFDWGGGVGGLKWRQQFYVKFHVGLYRSKIHGWKKSYYSEEASTSTQEVVHREKKAARLGEEKSPKILQKVISFRNT